MSALIVSIALFAIGLSPSVRAEVVLVVHPDSLIREVTRRQVTDLYLGRTRRLDRGRADENITVIIYEQPSDSLLRERFYRMLNGMNLSQVNAYWARLRFSGEVLPPPTLQDSSTVIKAVRNNPLAIGYIDESALTDSVRVVLRLAE